MKLFHEVEEAELMKVFVAQIVRMDSFQYCLFPYRMCGLAPWTFFKAQGRGEASGIHVADVSPHVAQHRDSILYHRVYLCNLPAGICSLVEPVP